MNKYKFENGYSVEWRDRAINPGEINHLQFEWEPKVPNMFELGNQFIGEYIYKFVPRMCQPIANRTKQPFPYSIDMPNSGVLLVIFKPNERPKYMVGNTEILILPSTNINRDALNDLNKN
jgi:hypothetical protein